MDPELRGFKLKLGEGRTIALHRWPLGLGQQSGERSFHVRCENQGQIFEFRLSGEAIVALECLYRKLMTEQVDWPVATPEQVAAFNKEEPNG